MQGRICKSEILGMSVKSLCMRSAMFYYTSLKEVHAQQNN